MKSPSHYFPGMNRKRVSTDTSVILNMFPDSQVSLVEALNKTLSPKLTSTQSLIITNSALSIPINNRLYSYN
jgi:hypothetical protein